MAEPARPAPGAVLALLQARLYAMEERVEAARRRLADRENLPGVNVMLDALSLSLRAASAQRREQAATLAGVATEEQVRLAENATIRQGHLQDILGVYLSGIATTHGHDFDMLIRPLRQMVKAVVPESEVVFQPSEDYYYRASADLIQELEGWAINDELVDVYDELHALPRVVLIEYPAVSESDVLQHAHIGHELAHVVLKQPDPSNRDKVRSDVIFERHFGAVEDDLKRARGVDGDEVTAEARTAYKHDLQRLGKWLVEFSADALGLHLIGPWLFFALMEFAHVDGNWTTHPDWDQRRTHPHLAWRLAHLADATRDYFDVEAAKEVLASDERLDDSEREGALNLIDEGRKLVEQLKASLPRVTESEIALEKGLIDPAVAELHTDAEVILDEAFYSRENFWTDLAPVAQKLQAGIPPAERIDVRRPRDVCEEVPWAPRKKNESWKREKAWSSPLDWRSIVNGSYLHWLLTDDPRPALSADWADGRAAYNDREARAAFRKRSDINAAVRGSVELSQLLDLALELRTDSLPLERTPHALA